MGNWGAENAVNNAIRKGKVVQRQQAAKKADRHAAIQDTKRRIAS